MTDKYWTLPNKEHKVAAIELVHYLLVSAVQGHDVHLYLDEDRISLTIDVTFEKLEGKTYVHHEIEIWDLEDGPTKMVMDLTRIMQGRTLISQVEPEDKDV